MEQVKTAPAIRSEPWEPLGLDLELIKCRDKILAELDGKLVEIEVLEQVKMTDWLWHVLIISLGQRAGEPEKTFYGVLDEPISRIFRDQQEYSVNLIKTIL